MKNIGKWFKGLGVAVAGGAVGGLQQGVSTGNYGGKNLQGAVVVGALAGLLGYFVQSPLSAKKE